MGKNNSFLVKQIGQRAKRRKAQKGEEKTRNSLSEPDFLQKIKKELLKSQKRTNKYNSHDTLTP